MGFLNSLFGGGNSKSTSTTNDTTYNTTSDQVDNRVSGDNSITGGNVSANTIGSVELTDYGAIEGSLGLASGALDAATNTVANAFTFGDTALQNITHLTDNTLEVSRQANILTNDIAGKALDSVYSQNKDVLAAIDSVNSAATGLVAGSQQNFLTAVGDTIKDAMDFLTGSQKLSNAATQNALQFSDDALDKTLEFASDNQRDANATLTSGIGKLSEGLSNGVNKIADVVKSANTSDSVQTIRYIMLGVAAVAFIVYVAPSVFKSK